jgi:hypothetical protein
MYCIQPNLMHVILQLVIGLILGMYENDFFSLKQEYNKNVENFKKFRWRWEFTPLGQFFHSNHNNTS